jgi:hypothetical protein
MKAASELSGWIGDLASNEVEFAQAMRLLCNYSLVESAEDVASYASGNFLFKGSNPIR